MEYKKAECIGITGASGLFFVRKLVHYSDIVHRLHIWYGNHTIFGKIKVYFIPYIPIVFYFLCTVLRRIASYSNGNRKQKIGRRFKPVYFIQKQKHIDKSQMTKTAYQWNDQKKEETEKICANL